MLCAGDISRTSGVLLAVALIPVSLLTAGCGSGQSASAGGASGARTRQSTQYVDAVKFARCMRAHGVNFPDPGGQGSHLTLDLTNVNTNAPKFKEVGALCERKAYGS